MVVSSPKPQVGPHSTGRQFRGRRKVRLGDVTPAGRLRLDALTRYTQDVSDDDTTDAGMATEPAWVVRRTSVDVVCSAALAEHLTFTTFCSGLGSRWAERRLRIIGDQGAHYEVATLWICIDPISGRPTKLTEQFLEIYGQAAGGRVVKARLSHPKPPPDVSREPWPLRAVDFDTLGHVNNAAYWAVVEEDLAESEPAGQFRATIEYSTGLAPMASVLVARSELERESVPERFIWWMAAGEVPAASASLVPLPLGLYPADSVLAESEATDEAADSGGSRSALR